MKILLINSNLLKPPITPLGLAYIAAATKEAGHSVSLLDLNFSDDINRDIEKTINSFLPDVIGISIRNIDNVTMLHSVYFIPTVKKIVDSCKDITDAPIVLGGPGFSMMPEEIMEELHVPYGVVGEGEKAFVKLIACIEDRNVPNNVNGIFYKQGNRIIKNRVTNMSDAELKALPLPQRDLLDNTRYLNDGGMGNIQTKRGCDRKCIYCSYPVIEGRGLRFRSAKSVVDEMEILTKQMGIDYLHFSDSTFNIPNEHAVGICREMIERNIKLKWTPYMIPCSPSEELMDLLKKTGCDGIIFGADSVSDKMLDNLEKGFTVAEIFEYTEISKMRDIPFSLNLLFGGPEETKETVLETLTNIDKIKPIAVGAMIGIRYFPGTKLASIASKEGFCNKEGSLLDPRYYVSPSIDKNWLIKTLEEYEQTHKNFFVPTSKKGLHTDDLLIEIYREGFRGPFWEVNKELEKRNS